MATFRLKSMALPMENISYPLVKPREAPKFRYVEPTSRVDPADMITQISSQKEYQDDILSKLISPENPKGFNAFLKTKGDLHLPIMEPRVYGNFTMYDENVGELPLDIADAVNNRVSNIAVEPGFDNSMLNRELEFELSHAIISKISVEIRPSHSYNIEVAPIIDNRITFVDKTLTSHISSVDAITKEVVQNVKTFNRNDIKRIITPDIATYIKIEDYEAPIKFRNPLEVINQIAIGGIISVPVEGGSTVQLKDYKLSVIRDETSNVKLMIEIEPPKLNDKMQFASQDAAISTVCKMVDSNAPIQFVNRITTDNIASIMATYKMEVQEPIGRLYENFKIDAPVEISKQGNIGDIDDTRNVSFRDLLEKQIETIEGHRDYFPIRDVDVKLKDKFKFVNSLE